VKNIPVNSKSVPIAGAATPKVHCTPLRCDLEFSKTVRNAQNLGPTLLQLSASQTSPKMQDIIVCDDCPVAPVLASMLPKARRVPRLQGKEPHRAFIPPIGPV